MKKILMGAFLILLPLLVTGCEKSIEGKWKSVDTNNEYYYIFNKDNTCSYEMTIARLDCTYEKKDGTLKILFDGKEKQHIYEYRFEKNNLIIKDNTGKDNKFIKE